MDEGQISETTWSPDENIASTPEGDKINTTGFKRTPLSSFKKVHRPFKSPLQLPESAIVSHEEEVTELHQQRAQLDEEIAQLEAEGYRVEELEHHINMLHEYNDIKDIGQSLLGRLAALRGTTTRDLYAQFSLGLDD